MQRAIQNTTTHNSGKLLYLLLATYMCICSSAEAQTADTFNVYFPFNHYKIESQAEAKIDSMIFKDVLIHGQKLIILGYADVVGGKQHNDSLSLLRAKSVADYLISSGFDRKDITLCAGRGQIMRANIRKEGYAEDRKVQIVIDRTIQVAVIRKKDTQIVHRDLGNVLKSLKENETVALNNILFVPGEAILEPTSYPELENLFRFLDENKKVAIRIEGHICCHGIQEQEDTLKDGTTLSQMRAKTVYNYLVSKGIYKGRLVYRGLGSNSPKVWPERSGVDMEMNRRVDIRILSN